MRGARRLAALGLLAALALALAWGESFLALPVILPGARLGLANLVTVLALYLLPSWRDAAAILFIRVSLGALFAGGGALLYSGSGALFSFGAMCLLRRQGAGIRTVSAIGGLFHNLGQLAAALLLIPHIALLAYLPPLLLLGLTAGAAIGAIAAPLLPRLAASTIFMPKG